MIPIIPEIPWWREKPHRLIHTVLKDTDVSLDTSYFLKSLRNFSADGVLVPTGGILANYPTELEFHVRNSHLKNDFTSRLLDSVHSDGMRYLASFDFNYLDSSIAELKKDWLCRTMKGDPVMSGNAFRTCSNGGYQQEYLFQILEEVMGRYTVDGVHLRHFQAFQRNAEGVDPFICYCQNCKKRFDERHQLPLPEKPDPRNPTFRKYEDFKRRAHKELAWKIREWIKDQNETAAFISPSLEGSDVVRMEFASTLRSDSGENTLRASERVRSVRGSWPNLPISASPTLFPDEQYTMAGGSPHGIMQNLSLNLMHGGWLDLTVSGTLMEQRDRTALPMIQELFQFHKIHEKLLTNLQPLTEILVIAPERTLMDGSGREYQGLIQSLIELHIPFEVGYESILGNLDAADRLGNYKLIVLPDIRYMSPHWISLIDEWVACGGSILATGATATLNDKGEFSGKMQLSSAGVRNIPEWIPSRPQSYLQIRDGDRKLFSQFDDLDRIPLQGSFLAANTSEGTESYWEYVSESSVESPPKRKKNFPGLIEKRHGAGSVLWIPWKIGQQYLSTGLPCYPRLIQAMLEKVLQINPGLITNASPLVEVGLQFKPETQQTLLTLVNLSGRLGAAQHEPCPHHHLEFRVRALKKPKHIRTLLSEEDLPFKTVKGNTVEFQLPDLHLIECIVLD